MPTLITSVRRSASSRNRTEGSALAAGVWPSRTRLKEVPGVCRAFQRSGSQLDTSFGNGDTYMVGKMQTIALDPLGHKPV